VAVAAFGDVEDWSATGEHRRARIDGHALDGVAAEEADMVVGHRPGGYLRHYFGFG
jgi:hypothetical protein